MFATHVTESVPGAVATGLTLASSNDAATNDRVPHQIAPVPGRSRYSPHPPNEHYR